MPRGQEIFPPRVSAVITSGTLANRPTFGVADRYYWATDVFTLFRDTGIAWEKVGGARYLYYVYDLFHDLGVISGAGGTANQVELLPIQISETITLDAVTVICTALGVGGNIRVGIYQDNGLTPVGGALIVESASVAAVLNKNEVPIDNTRLTPGMYWLAHNFDSASPLWYRYPTPPIKGGSITAHAVTMTYGAFPATCPVTQIPPDNILKWARVASIP